MLSRRTLIQNAAVLPLAGIPEFWIPPPSINPAVFSQYGNAQRNLALKLHTIGASAGDIGEAQAGYGALYSEIVSNGFLARINDTVLSNPAAVMALNPASINIPALAARLSTWATVTAADVEFMLQTMNTEAKQQLLATGVAPSYQGFLNTLGAAKAKVGNGLILPNELHICWSGLYGAVAAFIALLLTIFAPEITVGVLFGTILFAQDLFNIMAMLYGLLAAFTCG